MPHCPRCHQSVDAQAVTCPYCRTPLKAYGHPGIPLHRATGDTYLCDSCTYHLDDTCNFPQRPYAKECTLYQDVTQAQLRASQQSYKNSLSANFRNWLRRYQFWLLILGLLLLSFLIVL
ncbi:zinc ribbon domain-containing protein [Chroococcidiopsis sp. TS-821]|uniref:zinc ribbon domain-containing protein n=1 Tax=Chroococcidiopsis sp. TS-821 TaxID=1378066 RepID=UPI000CEF4E58|nr:zinc ribbon domain-containing protein [Chroococcidiopsis sp. TS-821]